MTAGGPSRAKRGLLAAFCVFWLVAFTTLGVWQVERRGEKLALIAAVNARVTAPPQPAPGPAAWPLVTTRADQYRHIRIRGTFRHDRETLVRAVTERGEGFWVLTPLRTDAGWTLLVNRGFVPFEASEPRARPAGQLKGPVTVTGLLRMSEPGGAFLSANDPAADRWYSRDVAVIARARGLGRVAPYFIDADSTPNPGGYPVGGLTVIRFRNAHLEYALTWFSLAGLSLYALWRVAQDR